MPPLSQLADRAIAIANPKHSAARNKVISKLISDVAQETFTSRDHQEFWISLIAAESGFDGRRKSSVGATGLGQLMPQYVGDFGALCGLTGLTREDIQDDYTNALVSACLFRHLIEKAGGSIPLALAAYNAGPHGHNFGKVKAGEAPGTETAGYVTKIWRKRDMTRADTKQEKVIK